MSPYIESLSETHGHVCKFGKVDVDKCTDLAQKYSITAMPTFVIFEDGTAKSTVVGARKDLLKSAVQGMMAS